MTSSNDAIDELLDGFYMLSAVKTGESLDQAKARNTTGEPKVRLKEAINRLLTEARLDEAGVRLKHAELCRNHAKQIELKYLLDGMVIDAQNRITELSQKGEEDV